VDRYAIAYVSKHVGEDFEVIISGVNRFGLFVTMHDSGAEGFIPRASLGDSLGDSFNFDEQNYRLVGRRTQQSFQLGDKIEATLVDASVTTNNLIFRIVGGRKRYGNKQGDSGSAPFCKGGRRSRRSA
jgi:ribonuclease R